MESELLYPEDVYKLQMDRIAKYMPPVMKKALRYYFFCPHCGARLFEDGVQGDRINLKPCTCGYRARGVRVNCF